MYFWIKFVYVISVAVVFFYGSYKSIQQNFKISKGCSVRRRGIRKKNREIEIFLYFTSFLGDEKNSSNSISQNLKFLCDIIILIRVILVSFHIITINKGFDAFFQIRRFYWKSQLVIQFTK